MANAYLVERPSFHSKCGWDEVNYTRPYMYPKQEAAIFDPCRFSWIEASTKSGKTVGCICWIVEEAMQLFQRGVRGANLWWIAPIYAQAKIALRRLKRMLPKSLYTSNEAESFIHLPWCDATIWFKSGTDPDALYGEDVYGVVIDEASRCKEGVWDAVVSTLVATEGRARIIGNVKGRRNWAYRQARNRGPNDAFHRITAQDAIDAGVLKEESVAEARSKLPEGMARQLFDALPTDDDDNPFGIEAIKRCIIPQESGRDPKVWGWDLAKRQDWTVGFALDEIGYQCGFHRFQMPWEETITTIGDVTGYTQALVDATGVGDPIVERLQREIGANIQGLTFTQMKKQQLMENLAVCIQSQLVHFTEGDDKNPSAIRDELEAFEFQYTAHGVRYSAPEGMNDDIVIALALAAYHGNVGMATPDPIVPSYPGQRRRSDRGVAGVGVF